MMAVDLYLDGNIGEWVLRTIAPPSVGQVITTDPKVFSFAKSCGFSVRIGRPEVSLIVNRLALSVHYHCLFSAPEIASYSVIYNIHPGLLPWGRGYYPVFWSLLYDEPAGATLHVVDTGIDTGPIVSQERVVYGDSDTGYSLYQKVQAAEKRLFTKYWPWLLAGHQLKCFPQEGVGSFHTRADFMELKRQSDKTADRVDEKLLRASTFPGYDPIRIGAARRRNGQTVTDE